MNNIKQYNNNIIQGRPMTFSEVTNNKYDNIHARLYEDALYNYIKDENINSSYYKFIEIRDKSFDIPSSVLMIEKQYPHTKKKINLAKYWNNYQKNKLNKDINELYLDKEVLQDCEVIYMDYINGKAKYKSRLTGITFWAPFDYIGEDTVYSDEIKLDDPITIIY